MKPVIRVRRTAETSPRCEISNVSTFIVEAISVPPLNRTVGVALALVIFLPVAMLAQKYANPPQIRLT
jgi:hypothetical protein